MDYISTIVTFFEGLPGWWLLVPPAFFLLTLPVPVLLRRRRVYLWLAALCLSSGSLFSAGREPVYLAMLFFLAVLCYPLVFLPKKKKRTREETLYERFRGEREEPIPLRRDPPKVCCFEEPTGETVKERGMELSHVTALLDKLKREKLTPADRLEAEMLTRTVEGCRDVPLSDRRAEELSDCLSAVLRLMAKYS